MSRKVVLLASVVLALLSAVLLQLYKANIARELGVAGERVRILAAAEDLKAWSAIGSGQLQVVEYPQAWLPPAHIPAALKETVIGQTVGVSVRAGQPLLQLHLAKGETAHHLSHVIEAGMRALPLEVDRVTAFGGLLKAGDYVDILLTLRNPKDRTVETRTLLQGVAVLAVGGTLAWRQDIAARGGGGDASSRNVNNVTVLVTASEAELLVLAGDQGELSLTMRNFSDVTSENDLLGSSLADLLHEERLTTMQVSRDNRNCIQVNEGGRGSSTRCSD